MKSNFSRERFQSVKDNAFLVLLVGEGGEIFLVFFENIALTLILLP